MEVTPSRPYRIIRPMGSLFQADIYLAERTGAEGFSKKVVLWTIREELNPDQYPPLINDLTESARLSSALVTHILDVWRMDEQISLAVEHLNGLSLAQLGRKSDENDRSLPIELILCTILEAARGMDHAHQPSLGRKAIIHGDIRPQNIILGIEGQVKLTGFGFSGFLSAQKPRGLYCTWDGFCYQPAERLDERSCDPRSDVFSLGAVLLEAISGVKPYGTDDRSDLLDMLDRRESPIPNRDFDIPEDILRIIRRACAPWPEHRYASAGEMAEALHGLMFERKLVKSTSTVVREFFDSLFCHDEVFDDEEQTVTISDPFQSDPEHQAQLITQSTSVHTATESLDQHLLESKSHFIGRTKVMNAIGEALAKTVHHVGSAVVIRSEPGMGRSRILSEVGLRLSASESRRAWLQVRSRMSERSIRFSSIVRLFALPVGLTSECELSEIGARINRLRAFGLDEPSLAIVADAAYGRDIPDLYRARTLMSDALVTMISALVQEQTTIIAWDDLEWADEGSLSCLKRLLDRLPTTPTVILMTALSSFQLPFQDVLSIEVEPLDDEEIRQYVIELTEDSTSLDPALFNMIVERTGGSPLLINETMFLLRDSGRLVMDGQRLMLDGSQPLPVLEDAIRLKMGVMDRDVLKIGIAAALSGPALSESLLAHATGLKKNTILSALDELTDHFRLIKRDPMGLRFSHERHRRALLSAASPAFVESLRTKVASAILDLAKPGEGLEDYAVGLLIEAGEQDRAAQLLIKINESRANHPEEALRRFERALRIIQKSTVRDDPMMLRVLLGIGRMASRDARFDRAEGALRKATSLAAKMGEKKQAAVAEILLLELLAKQGKLKEAIERAKDAIPLVESTGDPLLLAQIYGALGEAYQQWGQYGPDLRYIEAAIEVAQKAGERARLGHFLHLAVIHSAGVGENEKTKELLDQVRPIALENDDPLLTGQVIKAETLLCIFSRDNKGAIKKSIEGVAYARKHGLGQLEVIMLHNGGDAYLRMDQPREAFFFFDESLRRSRAGRYERMIEMNEMYIGFIEAASFGQSDGLERVRDAVERAFDLGRIWNLQQGYELLGRALLAQGETDEALPYLRHALRYAKKSGVRFFIEEANSWLDRAQHR